MVGQLYRSGRNAPFIPNLLKSLPKILNFLPKITAYEPPALIKSFFSGENEELTSTSCSPVSSLINFIFFVLMVRGVPVSTEYFCSNTGLSSLLKICFPSASSLLTQFFKSIPMPPVTPTVVRNIGERRTS